MNETYAILRPMAEAPTSPDPNTAIDDERIILALFRPDAFPGKSPSFGWNGRWAPIRHGGVTQNGYDLGWSIAGPVGQGGFDSSKFQGWLPLPVVAPAQTTETGSSD